MDSLALLFDWLLAASARASLLTVAVLILQSLLRRKAPARWRYALWTPVLAVLLTPAFPESPWSVGSIIHAAPAPLAGPVTMERDSALTAAAPVVASSRLPAGISWRQVVSPAWLIGATGLVCCCLGAYLRMLRRFQRSRVPASDAMLNEVATLAREVGLRRMPQVWMASAIPSPAVTGLLHPTLLLPAQFEETLTAQEARLVLRHELTHLKRGDLPLNTLLCLLLALHWFNPLLWLAFFKARLDREAACDAQALDREQQPQRVAYGHTLLKVESAFSHHGLSLGFVGIFQPGIALRSRIQSIATQPTRHPLMKIALSLGIALLTFLGITKAASTDTHAPQILIEAKFIEVGDDAKDLLTAPGFDGVLNEEQLSEFWKKIETAKGVDILQTPRVTTRSGQEARIEIGREFAYKDADGKAATKHLGITLTLLPKMKGENQFDLDVSPRIVELEAMVKLESGVEQPVFKERRMTSRVTMTSGQTVVLGGLATSTKQTTEEHKAGRVTTKTEEVGRHTMVFVTARLVDPATGTSDDPEPAAKKSRIEAKLAAIVIPEVHFHETTLTEAIEFLRIKSRDLDPEKKGLNILVKPGGNATAKITLQLNNVPASEALRHIADLAGQTLSVERDVFVMTPAGAAR